MPDIAAIDGITGPGRRATMVLGEVTEVTFKLGKKVIEVVEKNGNYGSYDMAQVTSIQATTDGKDFTIAMISKKDEDINDQSKSTDSPTPESAKAAAAVSPTAPSATAPVHTK